LCAEEEKSQV